VYSTAVFVDFLKVILYRCDTQLGYKCRVKHYGQRDFSLLLASINIVCEIGNKNNSIIIDCLPFCFRRVGQQGCEGAWSVDSLTKIQSKAPTTLGMGKPQEKPLKGLSVKVIMG